MILENSIIKGSSKVIDLSSEEVEDLYVYQDGMLTDDYTFENGILTFDNINGNIELKTVYTKYKYNLQSYYPLSSSLLDESTIKKFGDLMTQQTVTPYYENEALLVNGIGLRTISGNNTIPDDFTIIIDYKPNELNEYYHHIWGIWLGENTTTSYNSLSHRSSALQIQNGTSIASTTENILTVGNWHRLIVTGTSTQWNLYINGQKVANTTTTFNKKEGYFYVGKNIESSVFMEGEPSINGYIKNLRIYNTILSQTDIAILGNTK